MIAGKTIGVVIPCHNEATGLRQLLPQLPCELDTVIVVDNNSTDETAAVARQCGARVVIEKIPGYGAAYHTGFKAVTTDIVVTMDGDGQYPAQDIPRLVTVLLARKLDFLSACRFPMSNDAMPVLRQVGNHALTFVTRLLFGMPIKDTQSGMWIFYRALLEKVTLTEQGMAFSEELKIKVIRAGLRFGEEHIDYLPRLGKSKLVPLSDGIKNLVYLLKFRFI